MRVKIFAIGLLTVSSYYYAQDSKSTQDSIKVQAIEDIHLHKTGNPNKAKIMTSKAQLSVMETPQPIAIVTHEIIEEQQSKQLHEVLQNVNGLYITSTRGSSQANFGGRGFIFGNENIFKNGARMNSGVFPEVSGLERVEVLKGANALMFGNVAAGGVVNMVTKKPRFNFGGSITLNGGSWDNFKPAVDFYGPLSEKVAFRVNGTYEYADSFRDVVQSRKHYFNPSFLFNLGTKTQLIVEGDYLKHDFTPDFGVGSITDEATGAYVLNTKLDRNAFVGTDWQFQNVQQAATDIILNSQLSSRWLLNTVLSYQNFTKDYFSSERVQWSYDSRKPDDRIKWKRPINRTYDEQNYASAQVNLNGEFYTQSVKHQLLIGADGDMGRLDRYTYYNPKTGQEYGKSSLYGTSGDLQGTIYLDDPSTWVSGEIPLAEKSSRARTPTQRFGVYIQDFVSLTDQWKILAGVRWSYLENKTSERTNFKNGEVKETVGTVDRAFSPKAGVVFTPNENLSVFGTYTNSFSPNAGKDIKGDVLKPSTIDQFEIGIKKNLWSDAVALNLSAYQIISRDTYQMAEALADGTPNNDRNIKAFAGKMKSQGVELDITGKPIPNLSIIGGFSYNHSVYTDTPDDTGYVENQRLVRTPSTTANASLFYTFTDYIPGFKLGASFYYIGDRLAGWNDTKATLKQRNGATRVMDVEDYTTLDLSLGYAWKNVLIQGKVGNVFDTKNYNVHENYSVNPITPRNVYVTFTYKL